MLFIKKVKENLSKSWDENIVKKAEELTNKKINFSQFFARFNLWTVGSWFTQITMALKQAHAKKH